MSDGLMTPIDVSKITITPEQLKKALTAHLAKLKAGITSNDNNEDV